jgi:hypothetical protein
VGKSTQARRRRSPVARASGRLVLLANMSEPIASYRKRVLASRYCWRLKASAQLNVPGIRCSGSMSGRGYSHEWQDLARRRLG